jgi:hypothetical protein
MSTWPALSRQISGPVVLKWTSGKPQQQHHTTQQQQQGQIDVMACMYWSLMQYQVQGLNRDRHHIAAVTTIPECDPCGLAQSTDLM